MTKKRFWLLASGYLLVVIGLFLYSYTQVDLNLTLSQVSLFQTIQKSFQSIGWFNRPLSTVLYLFIIILLFSFYFLLMFLVKQNKISQRQFWLLVLPTSAILLFSYNAFSYDLFNYMFDARIVTFHQQNPYLHKALDYPGDPWINFMRWTHRTYPYGPVWLFLTVPLSFVGFQLFLPTLFLFKGLAVGSFLASVYFIGRIMEKIDPAKKLLAMAFFAFNPLIIIEGLVSGHNDIFMLLFVLVSIFYLVKDKKSLSLIFLLASVGIKFATAVFLPLYLLTFIKKVDWKLILRLMILFFLFALIPVIGQREPYPWYFIPVLGIASLIVDRALIVLAFGLSAGLLLRYAPFLYFGDYKTPVPTMTAWLTIVPLVLSLIGLLIGRLYRKEIRDV